MPVSNPYLLEMRDINKSFPGVRALSAVSLQVKPGCVHALVGENGAGKSTLMKILSGIYPMDSGEIILAGQKIKITSPAQAQRLGISTIHQEFNLVNGLSVAENIYLSDLPAKGFLGWLAKGRMRQKAGEILQDLGLDIDPKTLVRDLRIAQQQIVEIAKALSKEARIIIMDEPTAALTSVEIQRLFGIIANLKAQGVAVIYISHKLQEICTISDEITVLRDGQMVGNFVSSDLNRARLISLMVGREVTELYPKEEVLLGAPILEVNDLSVKGLLSNISFNLCRGEILGVAGLMGAGQIPLARALFGLHKLDLGQIKVDGQEYRPDKPSSAIKHSLGLLTENRKEEGLVLGLTISGNISLASLGRVSTWGWISRIREKRLSTGMVDKLDIRPKDIERVARFLSGGNQQKVVLAKWLVTEPEIIILCEPTRGIDVGAKAEIYRLMNELVKQGKALLFISSELPEIMALSDRILVMRSGTVAAQLTRGETTPEEIMDYATGGGKASA